jgi:hypothetical protein
VDGVENAVDELDGFLAGESAGELEGFVDGDGGGSAGEGHLVYGQTQDVAVDGGHALHPPVLGVLGDAIVQFGDVLDGALNEVGGKGVAGQRNRS